MLKECSSTLRRTATLKILENNSNWDITMHVLQPYLLRKYCLKESTLEEEYEHSEDLDRSNGYFEAESEADLVESKMKLNRVVTTVSFSVRYFQGVLPICAALVQVFNEHTAYWLLKYLLAKCRYIQTDLSLYSRIIQELDAQFKLVLPVLYQHLEEKGFELNYFVMKWVLGLFAEDMPKPMLLGLWDLVCQTDVYMLSCAVLTIFGVFEDELLLEEADEIN
jgi:hypothetical protein